MHCGPVEAKIYLKLGACQVPVLSDPHLFGTTSMLIQMYGSPVVSTADAKTETAAATQMSILFIRVHTSILPMGIA